MLLDTSDVLNPDHLAQTLSDYFTGEVHTTSRFTPTLAAARAQLKAFKLSGYAKTRNHVDGNISQLNPYVTWGVFTLRELQNALKGTGSPQDYKKFVSELAWKAYFREGFLALGERVYKSLEPYKYPTQKRDELPPALANGATGLACIDEIALELKTTGFLHNHKRLWFAANLVHFENIEWWHGERLFYKYLLDGEPGPNALSWQWVASTFARKPYFFNAQNMRKYGHISCDGAVFDTSYETLDKEFFDGYGDGAYAKRPQEQPQTLGDWLMPNLVRGPGSGPLILLHAERLSERAAVLEAAPDAPVLVLLDGQRFKTEQPSFMRLHWAVSLAADLVATLREQGREVELIMMDDVAQVLEYTHNKSCESLAAPDSWHPDTWKTLAQLNKELNVSVIPDPAFAQVSASLRSFSSYWKKAQKDVMRR